MLVSPLQTMKEMEEFGGRLLYMSVTDMLSLTPQQIGLQQICITARQPTFYTTQKTTPSRKCTPLYENTQNGQTATQL